MSISMKELDKEIAEAIKLHPELRKVQLEARVNFAVTQALHELLELSGETSESLSRKAQIEHDVLCSISQGDPVEDVTIFQLAEIASALGYRFFFQFIPRDSNAEAHMDNHRPADEFRIAAIDELDVMPTLWGVND